MAQSVVDEDGSGGGDGLVFGGGEDDRFQGHVDDAFESELDPPGDVNAQILAAARAPEIT